MVAGGAEAPPVASGGAEAPPVAAGGAEAPPAAAGGCGQDIGIVGHRKVQRCEGTGRYSKSA